MSFKGDWLQFKYLVKHKYYVGKECFKYGLYWQGIIHDISKFFPLEWSAYRPKFFESKIDLETEENWQYAWSNHIHKNKHHWEYWLLPKDGKYEPLKMPDKYVIEMRCDWAGASLAKNGYDDSEKWYMKNKDRIILHPITRLRIEYLLKND